MSVSLAFLMEPVVDECQSAFFFEGTVPLSRPGRSPSKAPFPVSLIMLVHGVFMPSFEAPRIIESVGFCPHRRTG